MSATLGGLLKDYRLQKNLSQLEIAFAMGWTETSRISRIEQGKVDSPSRELIDRIIEVMKLEEVEKNNLLLAGNYLPTIEEIHKIRLKVASVMNSWKYPAVMYDFSWRVILENEASRKIYNIYKLTKAKGNKIPHVFEQLFNPNYRQNKYLKSEELKQWHLFLLDVLIQFKQVQRTRTKEKWYLSLLQEMMRNELFRNLWKEAQLSNKELNVTNYYLETDIHPDDKNKRLNFHLFAPSLIKDPRFEIEFHVPADLETFLFFKK